jgi:hypothetical protein
MYRCRVKSYTSCLRHMIITKTLCKCLYLRAVGRKGYRVQGLVQLLSVQLLTGMTVESKSPTLVELSQVYL